MSIEYIEESLKFRLSYQELKEKHEKFSAMNDDAFIKNVSQALHLACVICYLKEIPTSACLGDTGIIHELTHLVAGIESTTSLKEIRSKFNTVLRLA